MYGQFDAVLIRSSYCCFLSFSMSATARNVLLRPPQQPADRQTQLPEEWQSRGYEDEDEEAVPWYVEFPEDRAPKKQPAAEKTYQEPVPAAAAAAAEPLYKRFEPQQPQPAFKSLRSSRTLAEDVRYGFVMAQILDKPRSLKPYDDSF